MLAISVIMTQKSNKKRTRIELEISEILRKEDLKEPL